MQAGVSVEGLDDLRRALRRIDPELVKGMRDGLKDAAEITAREARSRAPRSARPRGRHMADTIRPRVSGTRASVAVNAKRRSPGYPAGYAYPKRIEYAGRAFLVPALEATRGQVMDRLGDLLDDIARTFDD